MVWRFQEARACLFVLAPLDVRRIIGASLSARLISFKQLASNEEERYGGHAWVRGSDEEPYPRRAFLEWPTPSRGKRALHEGVLPEKPRSSTRRGPADSAPAGRARWDCPALCLEALGKKTEKKGAVVSSGRHRETGRAGTKAGYSAGCGGTPAGPKAAIEIMPAPNQGVVK